MRAAIAALIAQATKLARKAERLAAIPGVGASMAGVEPRGTTASSKSFICAPAPPERNHASP